MIVEIASLRASYFVIIIIFQFCNAPAMEFVLFL